MLYQRCARESCLPTDLGSRLKRRSATPLALFFKTRRLPGIANTNCATELRKRLRNTMVVKKPVCTPVPPVQNGSAAGPAGFAPPASASPEKASHFPDASGTKLPMLPILRVSHQNSFLPPDTDRDCPVQQAALTSTSGKYVHLSRPRAADGPVFLRTRNHPDMIAVSLRCVAWCDSAQHGTDHQSRVRDLGELAHPSRKIGP